MKSFVFLLVCTLASASTLNAAVIMGQGLKGQYFPALGFSGTPITVTDSTINFDWWGSPIWGIPADNFTVRWTGSVLPKYTEDYRFYTISDDGVRLWINDKLVIDN